MANLTATLDPAQSASGIVNAPSMSGSGTGTILNGIAEGLHSFSAMVTRDAQAKRQAADDLMKKTEFDWKVQDRQAKDVVTRAAIDVNDQINAPITTTTSVLAPPETVFPLGDAGDGPAGQLDSETASNIAALSKPLLNAQVAVSQGSMSEIAKNALVDQKMKELLNKYPQLNAGVVAEQWKALGVDSGLFHDLKQQQASDASKTKAIQDERNAAYTKGREVVPPDLAAAAGYSEEDFINAGRVASAAAAKMDADAKVQAYQIAGQNAKQSATTFDQTQFSRQIIPSMVLQADAAMGTTTDAMMKALSPSNSPEVGKDPTFEAKGAQVIAAGRQRIAVIADNFYNRVLQQHGSVEDAIAVKQQIISKWEDQVFKPWETRRTEFTAAATAIKDKLGLDTSIMFPVLAQMKGLGIDYHDVNGVLGALPPKLLDMVKNDFSHLSQTNLETPIGKLYVTHAIEVLTGRDPGLVNMTDPAARQALTGTAYNYTVNQAATIAAGKGNPDMFLRSTNQVVLAAPSINAGSGARMIGLGISGIARSDVMNALDTAISNPATSAQAKITAQGSRAAIAHLTHVGREAMLAASKADPYHAVYWDGANSQFVIKNNADGQAPAATPQFMPGSTEMGRSGGMNGRVGTVPPPSKELTDLVRNTNEGIAYMVKTGKWDADSPKGTPRELAAYYAKDQPTSAMRTQSANNAQKADPSKPLDALLTEFSHTPDLAEHPGAVADTGVVDSVAKAEGLGKDKSSNAVGGFMPDTWLGLMKANRSDLTSGKSDAEILKLRNDPVLNHQMIGFNARDNAQVLANHKIPATVGNLNMMHLYGPGEGPKVLAAAGNTPIEQLVSSKTLRYNPWMKGKTVDEIRQIRHAG